MARFSVGREDDHDDGSSSPDPKRLRTTTTSSPIPPPQQPPPPQPPSQNPRRVELRLRCPIPQPQSQPPPQPPSRNPSRVELRVRCVPNTYSPSSSSSEEEEEEDEEEEDVEEEEGEEEDNDEVEQLPDFSSDEDDFVIPRNGKMKMNEERTESSQSCRSTGDGSISVILSDPDVLDCPICLEPLTAPVFQCENGHVACHCCCRKLKNTCPSCTLPIGYNRCRAIEKVIESIKIPCQNIKYGCLETVSYSKKHEHGLVCLHAPASCPYVGCNYVGSSMNLYQHFSNKHPKSATRFSYNKVFSVPLTRGGLRHVILQENNEGVIFILNFGREDFGTLVNVNCIGPTTTKKGYSYEAIAKNGDSSVVLRSVAENMPKWVEHSLKNKAAFLVVPREFDAPVRNPSVFFNLEVCIKKPNGGT